MPALTSTMSTYRVPDVDLNARSSVLVNQSPSASRGLPD
jgi:hypothetical protein